MLIKLSSTRSRVSCSIFVLADKIPMLGSLLKGSGFSFFLCTFPASPNSTCLAKHHLCRSVERGNNLFFCDAVRAGRARFTAVFDVCMFWEPSRWRNQCGLCHRVFKEDGENWDLVKRRWGIPCCGVISNLVIQIPPQHLASKVFFVMVGWNVL